MAPVRGSPVHWGQYLLLGTASDTKSPWNWGKLCNFCCPTQPLSCSVFLIPSHLLCHWQRHLWSLMLKLGTHLQASPPLSFVEKEQFAEMTFSLFPITICSLFFLFSICRWTANTSFFLQPGRWKGPSNATGLFPLRDGEVTRSISCWLPVTQCCCGFLGVSFGGLLSLGYPDKVMLMGHCRGLLSQEQGALQNPSTAAPGLP